MTFEEQRTEWEQEPDDRDMEQESAYADPEQISGKRKKPPVLILLCLLLAAAGAGMFYKDMIRDFRHGLYRCEGGRMLEVPAEPDPEITAGTAAGIDRIAQAHPDITQYMMMIPCNSYTQKRFLPEGVTIRDQKADLESIGNAMPGSLHWIDLTQLFSDHDGEDLYYATDPHLTGWGSRYAARAALEAMEVDIPEGKDVCYLVSNTFQGSLGRDELLTRRILDKKTERIEIYVPEQEVPYYRVDAATGDWSASLYDAAAAESADPMRVFFGGERSLTEIYTAAVNGEILLVVGDSMADTIVPGFVSSFEKIIFLHPSASAAKVEKLIGKYQPTKILYITGANAFMEDRALLHALRK